MKFVAVLEDAIFDVNVGLSTLWVVGGNDTNRSIKNNKGEYQGQVSYAYGENTRLWIVREDEGVLKDSGAIYKDLWSNVDSKEIPKYTVRAGEEIRSKSSIILPLTGKNRIPFGVVNFESTDYINIYDDIKDEIVKLTTVIQELILLFNSNTLINKNRNKIKEKISRFNYSYFKVISKQKIFLAYSEQCDDKVLSKIRITLEKNNIDFIDWQKISDSGLITGHIVSAIMECRFGICYLSEKISDAEYSYSDNSNVLLEAGMLCALASETSNIASNWIPIREEKSAKIPFDLQSGRILIVPRDDEGNLQEESFKSDLIEKINKMMSI